MESNSLAHLPGVLDVTTLGVVGDGATLNTQALARAIALVAGQGGGTLYFPPGDYLSGTIVLAANLTLYLETGATLRASPNRADYTQPAFIYAEDAPNVAIRGRGAINGSGTSFWKREEGRWRVGEWRPGRMVQFVRCHNLLIEDVTLTNSPAWTLHPVDCDGVAIRGITILNGMYEENGPNTDGIDPDGCSFVRISDCYLQTGDDSIVIKITNRPGGRRACRDIVVTNCVLRSSETALKIGSETHGEFRNISFSNCTIVDAGCGIGLWMRDGGSIDGWTVNNISMTLPKGGVPIYLWAWPRIDHDAIHPAEGKTIADYGPAGTVRNVLISNVTATGDGGVLISGAPNQPLEGITLDNVRITMRGRTDKPLHAAPPLPFPVWGHHRAPYDLFCRYVTGLTLRSVRFAWGTPEKPAWGSAMRCQYVNDLELDGFSGRQAAGADAPAIWLRAVHGAFIHDCWAPRGTGTFVRLDEATRDVTLMNNELSRAAEMFAVVPGSSSQEPFCSGNRYRRA